MVKLPVFTTVEEVKEFAAATLACNPRIGKHDPGLARFIRDGDAAFAAGPMPEEIIATRRSQHSKNLRTMFSWSDERLDAAIEAVFGGEQWSSINQEHLQRLVDWKPPLVPGSSRKQGRKNMDRIITATWELNDKIGAARGCIIRARLLLNITRELALEARRDEVIELAHTLYDENRLSDNPRDKRRDARMLGAYNFIRRTFDESKADKGNDPNYFDESHIAAVETKLCSTAGVLSAILEFNRSPLAKKHGKLTTRLVAIIANTMAKNTIVGKDGVVSDGSVPTLAIKRMLMHPNFNLPAHGSLVAAGMKIILTLTGAIKCAAQAVKPGWDFMTGLWKKGKAAKYQIEKWSWFSFLKAPAQSQNTGDQHEKNRVTSAAGDIGGGGAGATLFSSQYKGSSTPDSAVRCMPKSPKCSSRESAKGFWANLMALQLEFMQKDTV
jgi:hypothetical protein